VIAKTKNVVFLGITHCWSSDHGCFLGEDEDLFAAFLRALRNMDHSLKRLELQGNSIGFTAMNKLVGTIQRYHPELEDLNLQDNIIGYFSCNAVGHHVYLCWICGPVQCTTTVHFSWQML
jgi:hypothetical protein